MPPQKKRGRKPRYKKAQVAEALFKAGGNHTVAARLLGCSRGTVENYIMRFPDLAEVEKDARFETLDIAEAQLVRQLREGNLTAIIFYLKCHGKHRGYIQHSMTQIQGTVKVEAESPFAHLSDEEIDERLRKVREQIEAADNVIILHESAAGEKA